MGVVGVDGCGAAVIGGTLPTGALGEEAVGWFRRSRKSAEDRTADRAAGNADLEHLRQFAGSRHGVEAYLEPRTTVTETTVMLIAHDGEWTRRRVSGPDAAARLASELAIPLYEVTKVGYPTRMRDYNARRKSRSSDAE
jgi:hypothetical protein